MTEKLKRIMNIKLQKYYFDELYEKFIENPRYSNGNYLVFL